jgi:hypothetical protein
MVNIKIATLEQIRGTTIVAMRQWTSLDNQVLPDILLPTEGDLVRMY